MDLIKAAPDSWAAGNGVLRSMAALFTRSVVSPSAWPSSDWPGYVGEVIAAAFLRGHDARATFQRYGFTSLH